MSKAKPKAPASDLKTVQIVQTSDRTPERLIADGALSPFLNCAIVSDAYQANIMGKDVKLMELVNSLKESTQQVHDGDLSHLESMLMGQATALQTIFTSLAKRAQMQEYQKNFQAFLGLALKAQAQSRATIQAVVELKYPKQVAFVKQANISHGPQQVNNGQGFDSNTRMHARAEENKTEQNKLLEDGRNGGTYLDTGATTTAGRSNPALEIMGEVHRAKKHEG